MEALIGLAMLCGLPALVRPFGWRQLWSPMILGASLVVFVAIHLLLLSRLLFAYTAYCTWYFVPEIVLWIHNLIFGKD